MSKWLIWSSSDLPDESFKLSEIISTENGDEAIKKELYLRGFIYSMTVVDITKIFNSNMISWITDCASDDITNINNIVLFKSEEDMILFKLGCSEQLS